MTPSDEDLDCLLSSWKVPASPDSLEDRLRSAYRDRSRSRSARWFRFAGLAPAAGLLGGIAAGAVVFLLVIAEAFPQSLAGLSGTTFPFTVDSEEIEYKSDGSSVVLEYFTSAGGLVLSHAFPGDPVRTAQHRVLDPLILIAYRIMAPVRNRQEAGLNALKAANPVLARSMAEMERTCVSGNTWTAVGKETILNHATVEVQKEWMEYDKPVRFTQWLAPDLRCFTLKSTTEKTFGDGRLRVAFERRALKVTINATSTRLPGNGAEQTTHPAR